MKSHNTPENKTSNMTNTWQWHLRWSPTRVLLLGTRRWRVVVNFACIRWRRDLGWPSLYCPKRGAYPPLMSTSGQWHYIWPTWRRKSTPHSRSEAILPASSPHRQFSSSRRQNTPLSRSIVLRWITRLPGETFKFPGQVTTKKATIAGRKQADNDADIASKFILTNKPFCRWLLQVRNGPVQPSGKGSFMWL